MPASLAFEDFRVGDVHPLGAYQVDEAEMLAFAQRYDPQAIHTDPEAAQAMQFGGLIASGWLTTAIFMRMQLDGYMRDSTALVSPGVDEIRWQRPVRAGDTLSGSNEIQAVEPSRSKPDRGTVFSRVTVNNQHGETVMTLVTRVIYMKRQPGP